MEGIVTDLKLGYDKIMDKLGFKHQHFTEYKKFLRFLKKEFKEKLTRTNNASEM